MVSSNGGNGDGRKDCRGWLTLDKPFSEKIPRHVRVRPCAQGFNRDRISLPKNRPTSDLE